MGWGSNRFFQPLPSFLDSLPVTEPHSRLCRVKPLPNIAVPLPSLELLEPPLRQTMPDLPEFLNLRATPEPLPSFPLPNHSRAGAAPELP